MEWLSSARSKRAALLFLLAGCHDGGPSAPARSTTVSVAVAGYVERHSTVTLAASRGSTVLPADSVRWSAAPASVGVLAGDTLQLVDTGTVTISAKVGDTTATKVLHIGAPPTIVFDMIDVKGSQTRTIFSITLDGMALARLASDSSENYRPTSWGTTVTYTSYRTGDPSLYSVALTGGPETSLDSLPYPAMEPAVSADGSHLAFVASVSGQNKIWTSTSAGMNPTAVTSFLGSTSVDEENPTWSPSGDAIVYVTTQYGNAELVELTLASSKETPLGDGTTTDVDPAWSPDGKTLAFASTRDGDVGIFLYTFATGAITRLSPKPANDGQPTWLADGRIVYTSWIDPNAPALIWIDPAHPTVTHAIATPTGSAPAHAAPTQER